MTETEERQIKGDYFYWLYDQVIPVRDQDSPLSYIFACMAMHSIPFNDSVANDSNRTADGEELRDEFIAIRDNIGLDDYTAMSNMGPASIFEVLVALSRRAYSTTETLSAGRWFRIFLENLGLMKYSDSRYDAKDVFRIQKSLSKFNGRKYDRNGNGGIFPLRHPLVDQRTVELWFQMAAYMTENKTY